MEEDTSPEADTSPEEAYLHSRKPRIGNMKIALFLLCFAIFTQSMMVTGAINVCISTIEKLYRYKSVHVAFIDLSYNIGFAVSSFLLGSYVTSRKLKWIGGGMFLISCGCVIFVSPVFMINKNYALTYQKSIFCQNLPSVDSTCFYGSRIYLVIMCLAYALIGIGAAPLHTLAISFIQEHTSDSQSGLYNGIYYASAAVGPAIPFLLFSLIIKLPLKLSENPGGILTHLDENWIGAYWLLYVLGAILTFCISVPLLFFPKRVNSPNKSASSIQIPFTFGRFFQIFKKVMRNWSYIFICVAMVLDGMMNNAIGYFLAKYIEIQFHVTTARAGLLSGVIIVAGAASGLLTGGFVIKYMDLSPGKLIRKLAIVSGISVLSLFFLFIRCKDGELLGVRYDGKSLQFSTIVAEKCNCDIRQYFPVCVNGTNSYYSACSIGCKHKMITDETTHFSQCSKKYVDDESVSVVKGRCDKGCSIIPLFMVLGFVCLLLEFGIYIPEITYTMRILDDQSRLFGLSIQQIFVRASYMLGPMYLGPLFDYSCKIFSPLTKCESSSNCIAYDLKSLSFSFALPAIALKIFATIFLLLSMYSNRVQSPSSKMLKSSTEMDI